MFYFCIQHQPNPLLPLELTPTPTLRPNLTISEEHQDPSVVDLLCICAVLAPIQLFLLWPSGQQGPIHPTVPARFKTLAPHGTLPHLLFISFITVYRYLALLWWWCSCKGWKLLFIMKKMTRKMHHPIVILFNLSSSLKRTQSGDWSGVLRRSGFVWKLPGGCWPHLS